MSRVRYQSQITLLCAAVLGCAVAQAGPMPEQDGWSGHVNIGLGAGQSETNMIAGISSIDLGDERISSLDEDAGSEDIAMPAFQFEVAYTMADSQTQFYLGNQVADFVSFDLETTLQTHLGIRQAVEGVGTFEVSLAKSSFPTDVWKDPYLVDEDRKDTERESVGGHIGWGSILGSPFNFEFSSMDIDLDDEDSGDALVADGILTTREARDLKRTGQIYSFEIEYDWQINAQHRLVPGIGYKDYKLDGDAMAEDGIALQLKHYYTMDRWRLVSKLFYRDMQSGDTNPIYNENGDTQTIGAVFTAFYSKPFGLEDWTANATASYSEGDSDIDFYDSSFGMISLGMMYQF